MNWGGQQYATDASKSLKKTKKNTAWRKSEVNFAGEVMDLTAIC